MAQKSCPFIIGETMNEQMLQLIAIILGSNWLGSFLMELYKSKTKKKNMTRLKKRKEFMENNHNLNHNIKMKEFMNRRIYIKKKKVNRIFPI